MPSLSLACLLTIGCAITPEAKLANAQKKIARAPFADQPVLFDVYEKNGTITPAVKEAWLKEWKAINEKREADRIAAEKNEGEAPVGAGKRAASARGRAQAYVGLTNTRAENRF